MSNDNKEKRKYILRLSRNTGGKAGKGHNRTRSIQIWYLESYVVKHIRFKVGDYASYKAAMDKAIKYCGKVQIKKGEWVGNYTDETPVNYIP